MESSKSRVAKSDFLNKGLDVLAADGPLSLTAARMAREMNVTTGSFYWHFNSVDEFRDEIRKFWRDEVVVGIIVDAKAGDPANVLDEIGKIIRQRGTHRYDAAMRGWAESDSEAAEIVRTSDLIRRDLIAEVLQVAGESEEEANNKSNLLGAAWRGSQDMDPEYRFKLIAMITRNSDSGS